MKKTLMLLLLLVMTLQSWCLYGQLTLNFETRPRFELRDGYRTLPSLDDDPAAFVAQRNRLGINFKRNNIETSFSFQNILIWGSEPLRTNRSSFGLFDAWVKFGIGEGMSIKSGRQELVYDNHRFLSNANWNHASLRHDLVLFQLLRNSWQLDVGLAFNQESERIFGTEYTLEGNYKVMNFVYFSTQIGQYGRLQLLSINDGFQSTIVTDQTNYRFTYGGSLTFKIDAFDIYASGYLQSGTSPDEREISAWYGHILVDYILNPEITLEGGLEILSGTDFSVQGDTKLRAFDVLYGAGNRFNGHMDYFTQSSHTRFAGLVNPYFSVTWQQNNQNQLRTVLHLFSLQNNFVHQNEIIDNYLGTEIDFIFRRNISKELSVQMGYSVMFAGTSMEIIKGGNSDRPVHWGYLKLTYRPAFLLIN